MGSENKNGSDGAPRKHLFQKGQSGNPGGRPKDLEGTKELARRYTRTAIMALVKICKSGDKDSARVSAAVALLDRGWGKPAQTVDLNASVKRGGVVVYLPPEEGEEERADEAQPGEPK